MLGGRLVMELGFSRTKMAWFSAEAGIPAFSGAPGNVSRAGYFAWERRTNKNASSQQADGTAEWGAVLGAADKAVSAELNVVPAPTELLVTWIKYVHPTQEGIFPFCYLLSEEIIARDGLLAFTHCGPKSSF